MAHQSLKRQFLGLVGWLVATFAAGSVGAIASARATTFYGQLTQPTWAPPAWLFGPVWSVLYILMAVAAWLIWRKHSFMRCSHRALALRYSTLRQRTLDLVVLRAASRRALAGRDCPALAAHRGNYFRVLASAAARRTVAGALFRLGKLRVRAYLVFVAVESCGSWLAVVLWPNTLVQDHE